MADKSTTAQLYELDRALLEEHGPSYIDTICDFAEGMRAEGRVAEADEAIQQCERMVLILMPDAELLAAWEATSGEAGDLVADTLCAEIKRRHLDT